MTHNKGSVMFNAEINLCHRCRDILEGEYIQVLHVFGWLNTCKECFKKLNRGSN